MTHTSSKKVILLVEDDEPKMKATLSTITEITQNATILTAMSVASATEIIDHNEIAIAIIDMSLPAFDFATDMSGGGQPQEFGGWDLLKFLDDIRPNARAIVLTQYEEFNTDYATPPKRLNDISDELKMEFGQLLVGVLHYSGQRGEWREQLKTLLRDLEPDARTQRCQ